MNETIQEETRTILKEAILSKIYWREEIDTSMYMLKGFLYQKKYLKTSYELWNGREPIVKYFKIFGNKCYIHKDKDNIRKFDRRVYGGIFLGYSVMSPPGNP